MVCHQWVRGQLVNGDARCTGWGDGRPINAIEGTDTSVLSTFGNQDIELTKEGASPYLDHNIRLHKAYSPSMHLWQNWQCRVYGCGVHCLRVHSGQALQPLRLPTTCIAHKPEVASDLSRMRLSMQLLRILH